MRVSITDDFSLKRIADCGQCFRAKEIGPGLFRFINGERILYISEVCPGQFEVSCDADEWNGVWLDYFDLNTNYAAIRASVPESDRFLTEAANAAAGIRILRQDPWEMLISFIISQRKSIPAIKTTIESLCSSFGRCCHTRYEDLYLFPSVSSLWEASSVALQECRVGYRTAYIQDAVMRVHSGKLNLNDANLLPDEELLAVLKSVKGVGDKVANCVSLFGYHRTAAVPIDVWVKRVIDKYYDGVNPFPAYGNAAGIMQQYAFFYAQEQSRRGCF